MIWRAEARFAPMLAQIFCNNDDYFRNRALKAKANGDAADENASGDDDDAEEEADDAARCESLWRQASLSSIGAGTTAEGPSSPTGSQAFRLAWRQEGLS